MAARDGQRLRSVAGEVERDLRLVRGPLELVGVVAVALLRVVAIRGNTDRMIASGGNIYFLSKIFSSDGQSFEQAASSMTGMTAPEYRQMMLTGGRQVDGNRYLSEIRNGKLRTNPTVEKQ